MPRKKSDRYPPQPVGEPVDVGVGWLLKAVAGVIIAALICVYVTACLLIYQGQWQLVFHPSHIVDRTPASVGLKYDDVRFDATETGHLQLAGWFVAADATAKYANVTTLVCHDNIGSLSNTVDLLAQLHTLGVNVFAFDYHGFGDSDWAKPSEWRIYQDSDAALYYLQDTRHLASNGIVPYGVGVGAAACAHAAQGKNVAALVLQNPLASMLPIALSESPTRLVPLRLFFRERFELLPILRGLDRPKLFIAAPGRAGQGSAQGYARGVHYLWVSARDPKMYWEEPQGRAPDDELFRSALSRFLDEYVPAK